MRRILGVAVAAGLLSAHAAMAQVGRSQGIKDANVATEAELATVPGLTPAIAKALVAHRPYKSIAELNQFLLSQGLTAETVAPVYRSIFVHVNLDAAPREEILLIPGVGRRMSGEFLEYRPYDGGMAEFRKEIGKYVDSAEVARLEQYVFVPIKLNTGTDDDIQSIPGLGRRMLREFKEYRPYDGIEKFRKEIGKYVDAKEVARLERFVVVK